MRAIAPLLPRKRTRDLAIYPHAPIGSDGFIRRFEVLFPLLDADGITYDVMGHFREDAVKKAFYGGRKGQYLLYARLLWKRIFQALRARHYRAAFIQRGLFPIYPDVKTPHLEKLVRVLCDNVTLDFWDPVHLWQPELTFGSLQYVDKVTVVNEPLLELYGQRHAHPRLLPIAVDISLYVRKLDYGLGRPIRLFYTGSRGNVEAHLEPLMPVLAALAGELDLELTVVGSHAPEGVGIKVRQLPWERTTYYGLLAEADLGLYPFFGDPEYNRWRVASKTIDYLATGLPFVGITDGLPAGVVPDTHMIAVREQAEWPARLRQALESVERRRSVGTSARAFAEANFSLNRSYEDFKRIAFERVGPQPPRP